MSRAMDPMERLDHLLSAHADQLLAGGSAAGDLPDELVRLAGLLAGLRTAAAGDPGDPHAQARAVATIAARIRNNASHQRSRRRVRVLGRRVSARAAAVGLAAVLATGGAAAAATGSLPDPVQRVVSQALRHFHISVPDPGPLVEVPGATHNRELGPREPSAVAAEPAALHRTTRATGPLPADHRPQSKPSSPHAHPTAAPTSTSQPNVAPTSLPDDGSPAPADPSPGSNGNAGGNGTANGPANGNGPGTGKAKGNAAGNGKAKGNGNGSGKAKGNAPGKGNGKGKGNGSGNSSGSANPPGKGKKPAV